MTISFDTCINANVHIKSEQTRKLFIAKIVEEKNGIFLSSEHLQKPDVKKIKIICTSYQWFKHVLYQVKLYDRKSTILNLLRISESGRIFYCHVWFKSYGNIYKW